MCVSNFQNNNKLFKTLNNDSSLLLKPLKNLKLFVNQFTNAPPGENWLYWFASSVGSLVLLVL